VVEVGGCLSELEVGETSDGVGGEEGYENEVENAGSDEA
jgi:hypothetical protein